MSALTDLHQQIEKCTLCALAQGRNRAVPGEGPEDARILFVGEGPGMQEDRQGRPFIGPAGQFLNELLASIGLDRTKVYITNVVKSRPPNNRDPAPEEIAACAPWLEQQIAIIRPKIIVTLGRFSMARYFPGQTISRIHGTHKRVGDLTVFAMYHPAAALHQDRLKDTLRADIKKLPALLADLEAEERRQLELAAQAAKAAGPPIVAQPSFALDSLPSTDAAPAATEPERPEAPPSSGSAPERGPEPPRQLSLF
ncbi:MAG: uracil-DNA glycosylase [Chloroflexi bacterium]|nr:uracil-DNA glycosylase [Chloroflexota bacterium]